MPDAAPVRASTRQPTTSELLAVLGGPDVPIDGLPDATATLAERLRAADASAAAQALAAALWDLYRKGAITLEVREETALGFTTKTDVVATVLFASAPARGIEAEMLSTLLRKSPRTVDAVVDDWLGGKPAAEPREVAMERIHGQLEASGLLDDQTRTQLAPKLVEVATGWTAFEHADPHLAQALVERVDAAIDANAAEREEPPETAETTRAASQAAPPETTQP